MKKRNLLLVVLSLLLVLSSAMFLSTTVVAADAVTVENANIVMEEGARIRMSSDNQTNGLRFIMKAPKNEYDSLKATYGNNIEFGIIIAPASYEETYGEFNVTNLFEEPVYDWDIDGVYSGNKVRIMNIYSTEMSSFGGGGDYMYIRAAITNIRTANLAREFKGVGYIKYFNGVNYNYRILNSNDNVRSMAYVAQLAINDENSSMSAAQKDWLDTYYVQPVIDADTVSSYTIEHYIPNRDGSYSASPDKVTVGEAKVGSSVNITTSDAYGDLYALDLTKTGTVNSIDTVFANGKNPVIKLYYTEGDFTWVDTAEDFYAIYNNLSGNYKLGADITISGCPNMETAIYYPGYLFSGNLNGNGHTLTVTADSMLFTQNTGRIENMTIKGISGQWGGLVAAQNNGVITNCTFEITKVNTCGWAYISGDWSAVGQKGCVVDYNAGTISDCQTIVIIPSDVQTAIGWIGQSHEVSTLCIYNASPYVTSTVTNCTAYCINNYNNEKINFVVNGGKVENLSLPGELDIGESYQLTGCDFASSNTSVATVSSGGLITAIGMGDTTITYKLAGIDFSFNLKVFELVNSVRFNELYTLVGALNGNYKLIENVTITTRDIYHVQYADNPSGGTNTNWVYFNGVLDGNGYTITNTNDFRMFGTLNGTVKNVTINGTLGNWGGIIASEIDSTGVVQNVIFNMTVNSTCGWYNINNTSGWPQGYGGIAFTNKGAIKECVVNVTIVENVQTTIFTGATINPSDFCAITGYNVGTISGCYVSLINNYNDDGIKLYNDNVTVVANNTLYKASVKEIITEQTTNIDIPNNTIKVSSSNENVATVNEYGTIRGISMGQAEIFVISSDMIYSYPVKVYQGINSSNIGLIYENTEGFFKLTEDVTFDSNALAEAAGLKILTQNFEKYAIFTGELDGQGHTLNVTGKMFYQTTDAVFKNLTVNITLNWYNGGAFARKTVNTTFNNVTVNATVKAVAAYNVLYWDAYVMGGFALEADSGSFRNCNANIVIASDISFSCPSGGSSDANGLAYTVGNISAYCKATGTAPTFINCKASLVNSYNTDLIEFAKDCGTSNTVENYIGISSGADFVSKIYDSKYYTQENGYVIDGKFALSNDIEILTSDLPDANGDGIPDTYAAGGFRFSGVLDGQGHKLTFNGGRIFSDVLDATIKNLKINYTQTIDGGLFGVREENSTIENIDAVITYTGASFRRSATGELAGYWAEAGGLFGFIGSALPANKGIFKNINVLMNVNSSLAYVLDSWPISGISALGVNDSVSYIPEIENCNVAVINFNSNIATSTAYGFSNYSESDANLIPKYIVLPVNGSKTIVKDALSGINGVTFGSSDTSVFTVSSNGILTGGATANTQATLTVSYLGKDIEITVRIATPISTETEFGQIYGNLGNSYILMNNLTLDIGALTSNAGVQVSGDSYTNPAVFTGILDGNGYTITTNNRLFYETNASKIMNLNIIKGDSNWYSTSAIAWKLFNDDIENVSVKITFNSTTGYRQTYWDAYYIGAFALVGDSSRFVGCTAMVTIASGITLTHPSGGSTTFAIDGVNAFCATYGTSPTFTNCTATLNNNHNDDVINFGGSSKNIVGNITECELIKLVVGDTAKVNIEEKVINVFSLNNDVVTVDRNGNIIVKANGTSDVYISTERTTYVYRIEVFTLISSSEQFNSIYNGPLSGFDKNYMLMTDITVECPNNYNWVYYENPGAGTNSNWVVFSGVLDGNGYTITSSTGMFLFPSLTGTVRNVNIISTTHVANAVVTGSVETTGVIENVIVYTPVSGTNGWYTVTNSMGWIPSRVSGIAYVNNGIIRNSVANITFGETIATTFWGNGNNYPADTYNAICASGTGSVIDCDATFTNTYSNKNGVNAIKLYNDTGSVQKGTYSSGKVLANVHNIYVVKPASWAKDNTALTETLFWLNKVLGYTPIVLDDTYVFPTGSDTYYVVLGSDNAWLQSLANENSYTIKTRNDLSLTGCAMKNFGNITCLYGYSTQGNCNALYAWLEEYFGYAYYGEDAYVISSYAGQSFNWNDCDDYHKTTIETLAMMSQYIDLGTNGVLEEKDSLIATRLKMTNYWKDWLISGHTYNYLLPKTEYPDFYPNGTDLCFTGRGDQDYLANLMAESAEQILIDTEGSERINFMFGQEDSFSHCSCSYCTSRISQLRSAYGFTSDEAAWAYLDVEFNNKVVTLVKQWLTENQPDREVHFVMFAYNSTKLPPVATKSYGGVTAGQVAIHTVEGLSVQLVISFVDYSKLYSAEYETYYHTKVSTLIEKWKQVCGDNPLQTWLYSANWADYMEFYYNFPSTKANYEYLAQQGTNYIAEEGAYDSLMQFDALRTYIAAQSAYGTDKTTEELVDEFIMNYYGEYAWYAMSAFYAELYGTSDYINAVNDNGMYNLETTNYIQRILNANSSYWISSGMSQSYFRSVMQNKHWSKAELEFLNSLLNDAISYAEMSFDEEMITEEQLAIYVDRIETERAFVMYWELYFFGTDTNSDGIKDTYNYNSISFTYDDLIAIMSAHGIRPFMGYRDNDNVGNVFDYNINIFDLPTTD